MKNMRKNAAKRIIASALSVISAAACSVPAGTVFFAANTALVANASCDVENAINCRGIVRNNTAGLINFYYDGEVDPFVLYPGEESKLNGEIVKIAGDDELVFPEEWGDVSEVTSMVFRNNRYVYTFSNEKYNDNEYFYHTVGTFRSRNEAVDNGDGTHSEESVQSTAHTITKVSDCDISVKENGAYKFVYNENSGLWINDNRQCDNTEASTTWNVTVPSGKNTYLQFILSSEGRCDNLTIMVDGRVKYTTSAKGTGGLVRIPAGKHTVTAVYAKDESVAEGYDSAYLRFADSCDKCGFADSKNIIFFDNSIYDYAVEGGERNTDKLLGGESKTGYWTGRKFTVYSNTLMTVVDAATYRNRPDGLTVKREFDKDSKFTYNNRGYKYKMEIDIAPEVCGIYDIEVDDTRMELVPKKDFYYDSKIELSDFDVKLSDCYDDYYQSQFKEAYENQNPKTFFWIENGDTNPRTVDLRLQIYRFLGDKQSMLRTIGVTWVGDKEEVYGIADIIIKEREVDVTPQVHDIEYGQASYPITYTLEAMNGDRGVVEKDMPIYATAFEECNLIYVNENGTEFTGSKPEPGVYIPRWRGSSYMGTYHFNIAEDAAEINVTKPLSGCKLTVAKDSTDYDGERWYRPSVSLYDSELKKELVEGRDFETVLEGEDNPEGGMTLHINGIGAYRGSLEQNWDFSKKPGYMNILNSTKTFDGKDISDMFEVYEPDKCVIKYYSGDKLLSGAPSAAGVYDVKVSLKSDSEGKQISGCTLTVEKTEEETAKAVIETVSVTFGGSLGLNYYITLSDDIKNDEGAYAEYTINGSKKRQFVSDTAVVNGKNKFTCPVYATQTDDNINFRIYSGNGELYTLLSNKGADLTADGFDYSVGRYMNVTKNSTDAKMAALASASIDYGAAAKNYFDSSANKTVSSDVTSLSADVFASYMASQSGTKPSGIEGITLSVVFDADNSLRLYYKYADGADPSKYTYFIDSEKAELRKNEKGYYLEVKNIAADKLGKAHTFTVQDSTDTYTVSASVLSYAGSIVKINDTKTQNLAKALYLYNEKAIAYAAK